MAKYRIDPKLAKRIAAYNRERDAMLMTDSVDALIEFNRKHGNPEFSCREVAEIAMHKTRTAIRSLPMEMRRISYRWLVERGYQTWDDGDLK